MRSTAIVVLLAVPALAAAVPKTKSADVHAELKAGLEAHMDGDDSTARRRLAACARKAGPDSDDAAGCRIYLEWWAKGAPQDDKASPPIARQLYKAGIDAYKKGQLRKAGAAWRLCLDKSVSGSAVRNDCLSMIDLVPKPAPPAAESEARAVYMEGFMLYGQGDFNGARDKWMICRESAPRGGPTWSDCAAGIGKLDENEKSR